DGGTAAELGAERAGSQLLHRQADRVGRAEADRAEVTTQTGVIFAAGVGVLIGVTGVAEVVFIHAEGLHAAVEVFGHGELDTLRAQTVVANQRRNGVNRVVGVLRDPAEN